MLMVVLLAGTVFTYFWFLHYKEKLRFNGLTALVAAIVHTIYGVLCVTVFAVIETMNIKNFGNLSIFGATFFMPLLFFVFAKLGKRSAADVFDIGTVSMMFTLMCSRFNCLVSGCCYGISFFNSPTLRWPTREAEIVFYVVLILVLALRMKKNQSGGTNYPIYMIAYGIFRFIVEWVRHYDGNSVVHKAHVWALISLALGISILVEMKAAKNKNSRQKS